MEKKFPLILLPLIAAAACLFSFRLDLLSYWGDEVGSILYARNDLIPMIKVLLKEDVHPPLYYFLLHWWMRLFGEGEAAVRFLSVFPAALSLVVVYKLAKELMNARAALVTVILLAFSPELLLFARMARYYSLAFLFASLSTYLFFKILKGAGSRYLICYVVVSALLLYTTYTTLSVLIAQNIIFLIGFKDQKRMVKSWIAAQFSVFLLYLPCIILFLSMISRMAGESHAAAGLGGGIAGVLMKIFYTFYAFCFGETLFPWRFGIVMPAVFIFIMLICAAAMRRDRIILYLVTLIVVPLFFTIFIFSTVKTSMSFIYTPSRTLFALPFFLMLAAAGIDRLQNKWVMALSTAALIAVSLVSISNYFNKKDFIVPAYAAPWREVVKDVAGKAGAGDLAVAEETREIDYYRNNGGYGFRFVIDEKEAKNYLLSNPSAKLFYIKTGRDRQPSGLSENFWLWVNEDYMQLSDKGYDRVDGSYRAVKMLLLKTEPYRYKIELLEFTKK